MNMPWYVALFIVYGILVLVTSMMSLFDGGFLNVVRTPLEVYDETSLNWIGASFVWIIVFLLFPVNHICAFLWWVIHVGRSDY